MSSIESLWSAFPQKLKELLCQTQVQLLETSCAAKESRYEHAQEKVQTIRCAVCTPLRLGTVFSPVWAFSRPFGVRFPVAFKIFQDCI